jgi:hypothetical protein
MLLVRPSIVASETEETAASKPSPELRLHDEQITNNGKRLRRYGRSKPILAASNVADVGKRQFSNLT